MALTQAFRIAIVSDIHYAAAEERGICARYDPRTVKNPAARIASRAFHHFVWLRRYGAHNHLLDKFLHAAGEPDLVVANGDYSCNARLVGVSDAASFESARECLEKLRGRFPGKLFATMGDHDLGKIGPFCGRGAMSLQSWRRMVEDLNVEPFWRVQLGSHVLLGVTSSLVALDTYRQDLLEEEVAEWEQLREVHMREIRSAFQALEPRQRVVLFSHDPTALPFLWREEVVRERISQLDQTVVGHLHSEMVLRQSRLLAGLPRVTFLGKGLSRISSGLGEARIWKQFRVRLCPALTGIQLLKDGGYLTAEWNASAGDPARFQFHPISW